MINTQYCYYYVFVLSRSNEEKLDEKDVAVEDDTDDTATSTPLHNVVVSPDADVDLGPSNSQGQMKEEDVKDDEIVIEDFDA